MNEILVMQDFFFTFIYWYNINGKLISEFVLKVGRLVIYTYFLIFSVSSHQYFHTLISILFLRRWLDTTSGVATCDARLYGREWNAIFGRTGNTRFISRVLCTY